MAETYTKKDYLTAVQYSKTTGEKVEIVKKAMHLARLERATIKINTTSREIIIPFGGGANLHLRPEPAAQKKFNEYIAQIKAKGDSK